MYTHLNVVSYPRYPGKDPVTLTPMILEKKIPKDGSNGFDKQIVIYAALAQVVFPISATASAPSTCSAFITNFSRENTQFYMQMCGQKSLDH